MSGIVVLVSLLYGMLVLSPIVCWVLDGLSARLFVWQRARTSATAPELPGGGPSGAGSGNAGRKPGMWSNGIVFGPRMRSVDGWPVSDGSICWVTFERRRGREYWLPICLN